MISYNDLTEMSLTLVISMTRAFRRIRVDESRIRNKLFADTNESGYVWTEPKRF